MSLKTPIWILIFFMLSCANPEKDEQASKVDHTYSTKGIDKPSINFAKLKNKAKEAKAFCDKRGFNDQFCILIDMSVHSGLKRFVIWDFEKDTFTHAYLVGHGSGSNPWSHDFTKDKPQFSNEENSHCTSLGKYKIGARAKSEWGVGIKYVLHGLEPTNSNAQKRFVVFHSWEAVSDTEVYPTGTPEGWGCPILSLKAFREVDQLLSSCSKPVLMWIFAE